MKNLKPLALSLLIVYVMLPWVTVAPQADPVELGILWFNDGRESVTLQQQLDVFMEQNPGITVDLVQTGIEVNEFLLCILLDPDAPEYGERNCEQIEGETLPDLARTNIPGAFREALLDMRPYMEDPDVWSQNFNDGFLNSLRSPDNPEGIHGYPIDVTISAPFVNRTLWEEAGVPIPSDTSDDVSWGEWTRAAAQVQAALTTGDRQVYAMAMDRSGHRFWGPSLSLCASYVDVSDPDSDVTVDTPGFRDAVQLLSSWHQQGLVPVNIWTGNDETIVPADEFFIDSQVAFYFSGNWLLNKFESKIENFSWQAVPNPTGPCGQTGMIGGTAMIAMEWTEHPQEVTQLVEFLTQRENMEQFALDNLILSAHNGVNSMELDYNDPTNQLSVFQEEIARAAPEAFALQYRTDTNILHSTIRENLIQLLREGEEIDVVVPRIQEEIDIRRGVAPEEEQEAPGEPPADPPAEETGA